MTALHLAPGSRRLRDFTQSHSVGGVSVPARPSRASPRRPPRRLPFGYGFQPQLAFRRRQLLFSDLEALEQIVQARAADLAPRQFWWAALEPVGTLAADIADLHVASFAAAAADPCAPETHGVSG